MDVTKAKQEIEEVIAKLTAFRDSLGSEPPAPPVNVGTPTFQAPAVADPLPEILSIEELTKALNSDQWPQAAHPNMVCDPNDEAEKFDRGRGVVELMVENDVTGVKFLDFGCGEGHCAAYAAGKGATVSVGYDVTNQNWAKIAAQPNLKLTTDWNEVVQNGPYDIILSFDVIDHLVGGETPLDVYMKLSAVLKQGGRAFVRHHPFTSRHALHTYHELNKAYVHLVFNNEELAPLIDGFKLTEPNVGVIYPLATYEALAKQAGFNICNRRDIKDHVEDFFRSPGVQARIMKNTGMQSFPEFQMSLQFIDYVFEKM